MPRRHRYLWIGVVIVLLRSYPPRSKIIPDHVGQSKKIVPGRGYVSVLDQREMQVSVERLFHRDDVFQSGDWRHADLLPELFDVGQRHGDGLVCDDRWVYYDFGFIRFRIFFSIAYADRVIWILNEEVRRDIMSNK